MFAGAWPGGVGSIDALPIPNMSTYSFPVSSSTTRFMFAVEPQPGLSGAMSRWVAILNNPPLSAFFFLQYAWAQHLQN